jgi:hypothetical protein
MCNSDSAPDEIQEWLLPEKDQSKKWPTMMYVTAKAKREGRGDVP